uniref:DUF223 domain-containing protein n=1 Tax=Brassica oleracea var. oleracea TaxID=109376 RepID=A0A0D3DET1_BRAOL
MASSAAPVDNAAAAVAVAYSTFESLRLGKTAQAVVGRLIRFWDSRNINKNGEFMGITILLLDELDSVIHGFIPANRASHYTGRSHVQDHRASVIRFIPSTRIVEVQTDAPVIKFDKFMVRRYDHLQVLANTNLELPGSFNLRFLVELAVDDGKDSATFVVFDKEMTKLTKQEAAVLALDENSNGGEDYLPSCLEGLTGKEFVFQIRVMPFNFTPNHRTFTVSTITEDNTMANHSKIV